MIRSLFLLLCRLFHMYIQMGENELLRLSIMMRTTQHHHRQRNDIVTFHHPRSQIFDEWTFSCLIADQAMLYSQEAACVLWKQWMRIKIKTILYRKSMSPYRENVCRGRYNAFQRSQRRRYTPRNHLRLPHPIRNCNLLLRWKLYHIPTRGRNLMSYMKRIWDARRSFPLKPLTSIAPRSAKPYFAKPILRLVWSLK